MQFSVLTLAYLSGALTSVSAATCGVPTGFAACKVNFGYCGADALPGTYQTCETSAANCCRQAQIDCTNADFNNQLQCFSEGCACYADTVPNLAPSNCNLPKSSSTASSVFLSVGSPSPPPPQTVTGVTTLHNSPPPPETVTPHPPSVTGVSTLVNSPPPPETTTPPPNTSVYATTITDTSIFTYPTTFNTSPISTLEANPGVTSVN